MFPCEGALGTPVLPVKDCFRSSKALFKSWDYKILTASDI